MKKLVCLLLTVTLLLTISATAFAAETTTALTLNSALKRAFNTSITLKNSQTEIEKTDQIYKDASSTLQYTPIDISFNPNDGGPFSYYYSAEFNKRKAEKEYDNSRRQLIIDVKTAYYDIQKYEKKIKAAEVARERSQIKLLQAKAKYEVGLITKADLITAEAQVATDVADLVDCQSKLDNSYSDLNKLLGNPIKDRYKLADLPQVTKQDIDVDSMVNLAAGVSYEIWTAEAAAKLANHTKLFAKLYDVGDYSAAQEDNKAADARESIRKSTRALCFSINSLYEKNNQLTEQIRQGQENLKVAKAQFAAGVITKDNVLNADYALKQVEAGQLEVASAYEVALDTLYRLTGKLSTEPPK